LAALDRFFEAFFHLFINIRLF